MASDEVVDEIINFSQLGQGEIKEIIKIMVDEINDRIAEKEIYITLSKKAYEHLAEMGFDSKFGARPLRRTLQREVEDYLAMEMLRGNIEPPCDINIEFKRGKLTFKSSASDRFKKQEKDVTPKGSDDSDGESSEDGALELSGSSK